ncbi:unnamed protein product [Moneuplotes crassus]|uniref:Uncharacterized protein n=1 Tax=Euplotes crassus TaxID=5936 RepID=A0AAD1XAC0_EUPCR|nr:unnamed protein product [Moneuplotes crassus]
MFFLFGVGAVLPFNAIVTAIDYFSQRFPTRDPAFTFSLILNGPNLVFSFANVFLASCLSLKIRLVASLMFILTMLFVLPLVSNFVTEPLAWILVILIIICVGIANAFAQSGIFGFAGMLPEKYIGAVMFGNGLSGIVMNVFRIITLAIFPPIEVREGEVDTSAFIGCLIYFAIAALVLMLCIFGYFVVCKTSFARHHMSKINSKQGKYSTEKIGGPNNPSLTLHRNIMSEETRGYSKINTNDTEMNAQELNTEPKTFLTVYKEVGFMAFQVFACFLITFVVFPGTHLSTHFDFMGNSLADQAWFSVIMITLYNFFDTIGRFAGGFVKIFSPTTIISLTITRLIFIPLSVLVQIGSTPSWIFESDWFRILNMAIFALTNGYNSTLCMVYGPSCTDKNSKERAGIIMSLHLVGGIFGGSLISSFLMTLI